MNKAILFIVGTLLAVVIVVHVSFFLRFDLYQFLGRCKKGYLQHCCFEFLIFKVFCEILASLFFDQDMIHLNLLHILSIIDLTIFFLFPIGVRVWIFSINT